MWRFAVALVVGFGVGAYSCLAQSETGQQTLTTTVVESGGKTTCKQGKNTRSVVLGSKEAGKSLPCEVRYKKETEQPGHDQLIYTANNDLSFCEAKAKDFVEKLKGMGWECN